VPNEVASKHVAVNTNPGVVMGTISYMSHEQAAGREVDARTDVFSMGVLLYEMLVGRLPFEGASPNEIIVAIIHKKQRPIALKEEQVDEPSPILANSAVAAVAQFAGNIIERPASKL